MKTTTKHSLLAASLLALAPATVATADEAKPDFGLDPGAEGEAQTPAKPSSPVPDIKIEIDGKQIQLDGSQIESMVGEVLKNLSSDDGKAAREMLSNLLGVEAGDEGEMLLNLMKQIPQVAGEGTASFELGGEPGIDFEAKAFMIGPDGEKREIEIDADEIRRHWGLHRGEGHEAEPVPAGEAEGELPAYYIGVAVEPAPEAVREHLDLPEGAGVVVEAVFEGSPAAAAGLREHDVIVKANGQVQTSRDTLVKAVEEARDAEMKLEFVRAGKTEEVTVKPMKRQLPSVSKLFVPKIEEAAEATEDLDSLRDEVRATHALLEQILNRLDKLEKDGE